MDKEVDFFIGTTTCPALGKSFVTVNDTFRAGEYKWEYTYLSPFGYLVVSDKPRDDFVMVSARITAKEARQETSDLIV